MRSLFRLTLTAMLCVCVAGSYAEAAVKKKKKQVNCAILHIDVKADAPVSPVTLPAQDGVCTPGTQSGFPVPDPRCSPGAVNPSLTLDILKNPRFRTDCVRNKATSATLKNRTYGWYGTKMPGNNVGAAQTCELDHIISLELGGADTLDNIWPQCGPSKVSLWNRYFKQKDTVENYLAFMVQQGNISMTTAQRGIALNWSQFLDHAEQICPKGVCPKH